MVAWSRGADTASEALLCAKHQSITQVHTQKSWVLSLLQLSLKGLYRHQQTVSTSSGLLSQAEATVEKGTSSQLKSVQLRPSLKLCGSKGLANWPHHLGLFWPFLRP